MIFYILYQLLSMHTNGVDVKIIETSFGKVKGRVVQLGIPGLQPVEQYLGIPYGQAPTGEKRFVMPQTASKWTNTAVKEATNLPPVCVQTFPNFWTSGGGKSEALNRMPESTFDYFQRLTSFLRNEKEDCLYLNLYVPERKG